MNTTAEENKIEADITIENLMKLAVVKKPSRNFFYERELGKMLCGKKLSWNWGAFFVIILPIWAVYRKIYWLAFLSSIAFWICILCGFLLSLCIPIDAAIGVTYTGSLILPGVNHANFL